MIKVFNSCLFQADANVQLNALLGKLSVNGTTTAGDSFLSKLQVRGGGRGGGGGRRGGGKVKIKKEKKKAEQKQRRRNIKDGDKDIV